MTKSQQNYLLDILDTIVILEELRAKGKEAFYGSNETRGAVLYFIAVVGEAARQVSPETRALAPDIQWRNITGMRDRVIHGYGGVSLNLVWEVLTVEIPILKSALQELNETIDRAM